MSRAEQTRPCVIAWTGHRPDLFADPRAARSTVTQTAHALAVANVISQFLVGGQRGVDTWAALAALSLGIPVTVILPVEPADFIDATWPAEDRAQFDVLLRAASHVTIIGGETSAAYTLRNRLLASGADVLIAVWTRTVGGGTAETIALAHEAGTPVREIVLPASPAASTATGRGV